MTTVAPWTGAPAASRTSTVITAEPPESISAAGPRFTATERPPAGTEWSVSAADAVVPRYCARVTVAVTVTSVTDATVLGAV